MKIPCLLITVLFINFVFAQENNRATVSVNERTILENPILKGFYPDPSICRVGEDYYLVTSSFEFYSGITIYHYKDFEYWEKIFAIYYQTKSIELGYH